MSRTTRLKEVGLQEQTEVVQDSASEIPESNVSLLLDEHTEKFAEAASLLHHLSLTFCRVEP